MSENYVHPDYPVVNGNYSNFGRNNAPQTYQEFYYPGYGTTAYPPDSRRNVTSWGSQNPEPQPTFQAPPPPQFGYGQPDPRQDVQPFSTYGPGSNQPKGLNSLMEERRFNPPPQQQWAPPAQQPVQQYQPCTYYPQVPPQQQWGVVPSFDRGASECWSNQYVQPRPIPTPNIDWNTRYVNDQPVQGCPYPQVQPAIIPSQQFERSWTEEWNRNKNMR